MLLKRGFFILREEKKSNFIDAGMYRLKRYDFELLLQTSCLVHKSYFLFLLFKII